MHTTHTDTDGTNVKVVEVILGICLPLSYWRRRGISTNRYISVNNLLYIYFIYRKDIILTVFGEDSIVLVLIWCVN
jgi:hypothetical protein